MQHIKMLRTRGLHWLNRVHMLTGILSYATSPVWLAVLVGIVDDHGGLIAGAGTRHAVSVDGHHFAVDLYLVAELADGAPNHEPAGAL